MALRPRMFYIPCVPAEGSGETIVAMSFQIQSFKDWLNMEKLPYCADIVGPLSKGQEGSTCWGHGNGCIGAFYQDPSYKQTIRDQWAKVSDCKEFLSFLPLNSSMEVLLGRKLSPVCRGVRDDGADSSWYTYSEVNIWGVSFQLWHITYQETEPWSNSQEVFIPTPRSSLVYGVIHFVYLLLMQSKNWAGIVVHGRVLA